MEATRRRGTPRARAASGAAALALLLVAGGARGQTVRGDLVVTNGTVNAQVAVGDTLYLGGSFSAVGPPTGAGVPVDSVTAAALPGFPQVTGQVNAVVADGAGGWFLGGAFTLVGGVPRSNLAHVLADQSVSPWNPAPDGAVNALALSGGVLYAGGAFANVGGAARNRIAALDPGTGLATPWDPNANGTVNALAVSGGLVYAGGAFTGIGGQARNRIAALDAGSGLATAWNPNANSTVRALAAGNGVVYAGGDFLLMGGQARTRIAAVDSVSGLVTAWNAAANSSVFAILVGGGVVYVGGTFTSIGGQTRGRIAALDPASGLATPWNPSASSQVLALALSGNTLYAGGDFLSAGGQSRSRVAAIDAVSGAATAWDPAAYGTVSALAVQSGVVYVGGIFSGLGGSRRANLAAVDIASGAVTAWDPEADNQVFALAAGGGLVYAGGSFSVVGGQSRPALAAIEPVSGAVSPWAPGCDGQVTALALGGNKVYVGGQFSFTGGQSRDNIAALDATSGLATPWAQGTDGQVFALAPAGAGLLAGGNFATAGGLVRGSIAAFDTTTGDVTAWDPEANGTVRAFAVNCGTVYTGGFFTSIGGQARNRAAALDVASGAATPWNPNASGPLFALLLGGGRVYAGGIFATIGGQTRNRVAALDPSTGLASAWNPNVNGTVRSLALGGGDLLAAGSFSTVGALVLSNLAGVTADASTPCPTIVLSPTTLPLGSVGNAYAQNMTASGSPGPYCWSVSAGRLPDGLALNGATGALGGTPTRAGTFAFTLTATDASGCSGSLALSLTVNCPAITLSPATLPDGTRGAPYSQALLASGGHPTYQFALLDGALPAGLALSAGGVISGTPTTQGASAFAVRVTDAFGCSAARQYTLTIFSGAASSSVAPVAAGLCVNPAHPCVSVPFTIVRGDSTPVRALSVTFAIDSTKVALCTPGAPGSSVQVGDWASSFGNVLSQVVPHGSGSFTVDQTLLGSPCGITGGGVAFTVDLASIGADGKAALVVTAVTLRDCNNLPLAATAGPADSLLVQNTPLALRPDSLPAATVGAAYAETLTVANGHPPVAFALLSGTLPPGLALSAGGVLAGTPTAAGAFPVTIGASDVLGCAGSRAYTLEVACNAVAVAPADLPDGVLGVAYAETLLARRAQPPLAWSVSAGALPAGLALSPTGQLTGTPAAPGTSSFSVQVVDGYGCPGSASYTMTVFPTTPQSVIAAEAGGTCITNPNPCARVPFTFTRADSVPVRAVSVTFQIDVARLALCTPATPAASIHAGTWDAAFAPGTSLLVTDNGYGSYTVDQSVLGEPCGVTGGGTLFGVDLHSVGEDGLGAITVTAVHVRDCANVPVPARAGAPALLAIDHTGPPPVTDLAAAPVATGNAPGATTGIALTWSTGGPGAVSLYRAPFGSYPIYDGAGPVTPPDPTLAPGAPWTLAVANATTGVVDRPAARGFWYYVALVTDSCGAPSAVSNRTAGTLDYHLGDVSDGATPGQGDDQVTTADLSLLGANYGITEPTISARGVTYLDVGPTTDGQVTSRPTPDHRLDFEDLMMFATNFRVVSAPPATARPAAAGEATGGGPEDFAVRAPALVEPGTTVSATLTMTGAGRVQGFSARLEWDSDVVEPLATRAGAFVAAQGGVVLVPKPGTVDAALLGRRARGLLGAGEVATLSFRVLRQGDAAIRLVEVKARDAGNHPLAAGAVVLATQAVLPPETVLLTPAPNPFTESVALTFALARPGPAALTVYSVDGRRVRTLSSGPREAGVYRMTWDGRADGGGALAPGMFYAKLEAGGRTLVRRLVLLR